MQTFIVLLTLTSAFLETLSYYYQWDKVRKTGHSKDVSTSAYGSKVLKYILTIGLLVLVSNWTALILESWALTCGVITYVAIIKNKPDSWEPNSIEKHIRRITK